MEQETDTNWNPHSDAEQPGAALTVSPFNRRSTRSASVSSRADAEGDGSDAEQDAGGMSESNPPPVRRVLKPARKKGWNSIADKE